MSHRSPYPSSGRPPPAYGMQQVRSYNNTEYEQVMVCRVMWILLFDLARLVPRRHFSCATPDAHAGLVVHRTTTWVCLPSTLQRSTNSATNLWKHLSCTAWDACCGADSSWTNVPLCKPTLPAVWCGAIHDTPTAASACNHRCADSPACDTKICAPSLAALLMLSPTVHIQLASRQLKIAPIPHP